MPISIINVLLLTLPGFFRPTKLWDLLVVHKGELIAAIELKSQIDLPWQQFQQRTEEAIGTAHDLWTAYREGHLASSASVCWLADSG